MIMDDYSDNLDDNFEEEYLDEEEQVVAKTQAAKPAPKNEVKKDFWDPPKAQQKVATNTNTTKAPLQQSQLQPQVQSQASNAQLKKPLNQIGSQYQLPASKSPVLTTNTTKPLAAAPSILKDGDDDDDEDNYEEDNYDEDFDNEEEEEKFKKTAAEFAKTLNDLRNQNEKNNKTVDKLESKAKEQSQTKVGTQQPQAKIGLKQSIASPIGKNSVGAKSNALGGGYKLPTNEDEDDEYGDDDHDNYNDNNKSSLSPPIGKKLDNNIKPTNSVKQQPVSKTVTQNTAQQSSLQNQKPIVNQQKSLNSKDYKTSPEIDLNNKKLTSDVPKTLDHVSAEKTKKQKEGTSNNVMPNARIVTATTNEKLQSSPQTQATPEKYRTKQIEERNPYKFIEKTLVEAKQKLDRMKGTPQLLETLSDNQKKKKYLNNENKQLRDQLKKMSENVNVLIEKMNQESLKKKKYGGVVNSRPGSQKIRTREKEVQNTDKAIQNLIREHNKVKRRLEEVQNPDFLLNLKKNLRNTEKDIKDHEKLLQVLHVEQVRREKRLDKIIEKNEPETMKSINDSQSRLTYLTEKVSDLKEQLEKAEKLKVSQQEHLEELKSRSEKISQIAEHYGIEIDKHQENQEEFDKLQKEIMQLEKQKKIVKSSIDTMSKRYETAIQEKKKEYEALYMKKAMILKSYNDKIRILKNKGQEIQDLIERAKTGADKGLIEILKKWEEANLKIFEKYPEGEVDYSILEAAAVEAQKLEASHNEQDLLNKEMKRKEEELSIKVKIQAEKEKQQKAEETIRLKKDMAEREKEDQEQQRLAQQAKQDHIKKLNEQKQAEAISAKEKQDQLALIKQKQEQAEKDVLNQKKADENVLVDQALKNNIQGSPGEKKPSIGSKPFMMNNKKNTETNQANTQQAQVQAKPKTNIHDSEIQDDIEDEVVQEEVKDHSNKKQQSLSPEKTLTNKNEETKSITQQQNSTSPVQSVAQDQSKSTKAFAKPSFMMKPSVGGQKKDPTQTAADQPTQGTNSQLGHQQQTNDNTAGGALEQKQLSFTEKYKISQPSNEVNTAIGATGLLSQSSLAKSNVNNNVSELPSQNISQNNIQTSQNSITKQGEEQLTNGQTNTIGTMFQVKTNEPTNNGIGSYIPTISGVPQRNTRTLGGANSGGYNPSALGNNQQAKPSLIGSGGGGDARSTVGIIGTQEENKINPIGTTSNTNINQNNPMKLDDQISSIPTLGSGPTGSTILNNQKQDSYVPSIGGPSQSRRPRVTGNSTNTTDNTTNQLNQPRNQLANNNSVGLNADKKPAAADPFAKYDAYEPPAMKKDFNQVQPIIGSTNLETTNPIQVQNTSNVIVQQQQQQQQQKQQQQPLVEKKPNNFWGEPAAADKDNKKSYFNDDGIKEIPMMGGSGGGGPVKAVGGNMFNNKSNDINPIQEIPKMNENVSSINNISANDGPKYGVGSSALGTSNLESGLSNKTGNERSRQPMKMMKMGGGAGGSGAGGGGNTSLTKPKPSGGGGASMMADLDELENLL